MTWSENNNQVAVLAAIRCCLECPHTKGIAGGRILCGKLNKTIEPGLDFGIPDECPLPRCPGDQYDNY